MLRCLILALALAAPAFAQELPVPLTDTVSDFADLLPPTDEARIAAQLEEVRQETGVHVVVVTMDRTGNYGGAGLRVEDYAKRLFNDWGIGDPARNDGILMLVAAEDRVTRIALGAGYDAVYDGRASRVVDTAMLPAFREGRWVEGVEAGVQSVRDRLITPFLAGQPVTETEGFAEPASSTPIWAGGLAAALAGLIFGGRAFWRRRNRCPKCGEPTLKRQTEVMTPATRQSPGNGMSHLICESCGFTERKTYSIPALRGRDRGGKSGRGGGRGGSGGFGGGSSSGGGATGRW